MEVGRLHAGGRLVHRDGAGDGGDAGSSAGPAATDAQPEVTAMPSPAGSRDLILATTTSTQDSGLLDVLVPAFSEATG